MQTLELKAVSREKMGKSESRRFRAKGLVPAILYGKGMTPKALAVPLKDLDKATSTSAGMNAIIQLQMEGKGKAETVTVMLRDYQADVLGREFTHADFVKLDMTAKMKVMVPVHIIGKSKGVAVGGLVEHSRREIEVECLPTTIPNKIEIDITDLDIGHSIHVDELKLPEGVSAVRESNFTIVGVVAPAAEEEKSAEIVAAGAVPVVGEKPGEAAGTEAVAPADKKGEKKAPEKKGPEKKS